MARPGTRHPGLPPALTAAWPQTTRRPAWKTATGSARRRGRSAGRPRRGRGRRASRARRDRSRRRDRAASRRAEVAARMAAIGDAPCSWSRAISRATMSAVTPTSPVSVPVAIGIPSSIAASVDARWRRSMRSCRSRWTGVRPGSVRLTSVTTRVGTRKAPDRASASIAARSASHACSTLSTPAAAERRTDSPSCAWLMTLTPSSAAVVDDRPELRLGQLGRSVDHPARLVSRRGQHRRLRCDDLDDVGAVADDAARRRRRAPRGRPPRARTRGRARRSLPTAVPATTRRGPDT